MGETNPLPRCPGRRASERCIWQLRFWEHVITDTDDLAQHIAYAHGNPAKHRLVTEMDDWPHSSWQNAGHLLGCYTTNLTETQL